MSRLCGAEQGAAGAGAGPAAAAEQPGQGQPQCQVGSRRHRLRQASLERTARGLGRRAVCSPAIPLRALGHLPRPSIWQRGRQRFRGLLPQVEFHVCSPASAPSGKEPLCQCRRCKRGGFNLWAGRSPDQEDPSSSWRRAWRPTPVFLPRESHGQRSLAGYSP